MKAYIHIVERDVKVHLDLALIAVYSHWISAFDVVHCLLIVFSREERLEIASIKAL